MSLDNVSLLIKLLNYLRVRHLSPTSIYEIIVSLKQNSQVIMNNE